LGGYGGVDMPKMKYWNGTQWVPLDAANADTLEGLTVSQIRAGTTKTDVGLGNVDNVKQASKAEFDAHVAEFDAHVAEFDAHVADNTNPHNVTKSQVGLSKVENMSATEIRTATNRSLKVEVASSSVSETPDAGRIIFDTSQGKFFGGNGTEWV